MGVPLLGAIGNALTYGGLAFAAPQIASQIAGTYDELIPEGYEISGRWRNSRKMHALARDLAMAEGIRDSAVWGEEKVLNHGLRRLSELGRAARSPFDFRNARTEANDEASFMEALRAAYGPRLGQVSISEAPSFAEFAAKRGVDPRPYYMRD